MLIYYIERMKNFLNNFFKHFDQNRRYNSKNSMIIFGKNILSYQWRNVVVSRT